LNLQDLEYIFESQRLEGTRLIYFMLEDGDVDLGGSKTIMRHSIDDLGSLLPMLADFTYSGSAGRMPRFAK